MSSAKRILLDNAFSAWRKAISYCDVILSGRSTFDNRKNFVSALHNAVELFLKQIMLDQNDYRVATPKKLKDAACDLARRFYSSQDLNTFFKSLSDQERDKFTSVEFNQLRDIHTQLLPNFFNPGESFTNELKTLANLRNNETHFFIDPQTYLTEAEFKQLYNFMVSFYKALKKFHLLPFFGKPFKENTYLAFDRTVLTHFSYENAIKNSEIPKLIHSCADGLVIQEWIPNGSYEITEALQALVPQLSTIPFDLLWEYVDVMTSLNLIEFIQTESDYELNYNPDFGYDYDKEIEIYNFALKINM